MNKQATTGDVPTDCQVTVTLPTPSAALAFRDWIASGSCVNQFWNWMGYNGYHI